MGEHEEIRKAIVGSSAGNDCLGSDDFMRDLILDGYLHSFITDNLIYVQDYALNYDICRFASAREKVLAETLTSKGASD